ncbi:MAG: hypothetical protein PHV51_06415 [Methanosarcinaceae archaeon]|nr:hypothetical protein [Methanosarcinaceae archaeon]
MIHKSEALDEVEKWTYKNRPVALKVWQAWKTEKIYPVGFGESFFESPGPDLLAGFFVLPG